MEKRKFQTVIRKELTKIIAQNLETPIVHVVNSQIKTVRMYGTQIRYQLIVACDVAHVNFLNMLDDLREKADAELFLKEENPESPMSRLTFPFSSKVMPEICLANGTNTEMSTELQREQPIQVIFDVMSYTDKATGKIRLTFPMKKIIIHE